MRAFIIAILISFCTQACGGASNHLSRSEREQLRQRSETAHSQRKSSPRPRGKARRQKKQEASSSEIISKRLPHVPDGVLWGDGMGVTLHDAVLDGRRIVSEQIIAQLTSESQSFESSSNRGDEYETRVHIKSVSDFEHAELIKTIGAVRRKSGFVARVALRKSDAIEAYRADADELNKRLVRLTPILEKAIRTSDTAILLNARYSPRVIYSELVRIARVLRFFGVRDKPRLPERLAQVEERASLIRSAAVIQLKLSGTAPKALQMAVAGLIGEVLETRGCTLEPLSRKGRGAAAVLDLEVATRNHREIGVLWRYLGLQLAVRDGVTGKTFATFTAMPEFVHGGGPSWPMADQALTRQLGPALSRKVKESGLINLYCQSL